MITKYLITATLIVLISEVAKRSDKLGGLIAALPLVTLLTLFWLYFERQPAEKIANHAYYTFWYVLPTLPMFFVFPMLLQKFGFWGAMLLSVVITILCFAALTMMLKPFGIDLLP